MPLPTLSWPLELPGLKCIILITTIFLTSLRANAYEIKTMIGGKDVVEKRLAEIKKQYL